MDHNQLAQLQEAMHRAGQAADNHIYAALAIAFGAFIFQCWLIYMCYARLRDIEDHLRRFHTAYEFAATPHSHSRAREEQASAAAWPEPPKPLTAPAEDAKYMPKS